MMVAAMPKMAAPVGPVLGSLLSIRMEGKPPGGCVNVQRRYQR